MDVRSLGECLPEAHRSLSKNAILSLPAGPEPPFTLICAKCLNLAPRFSAQEMNTYHDKRETNAKKNSIRAKHPNIIMGLHDPRRKRNAHYDLLTAIWVPIVLEIFPDGFIGKPAARLDQVNLDRLLRTLYRLW